MRLHLVAEVDEQTANLFERDKTSADASQSWVVSANVGDRSTVRLICRHAACPSHWQWIGQKERGRVAGDMPEKACCGSVVVAHRMMMMVRWNRLRRISTAGRVGRVLAPSIGGVWAGDS